MSKTAKEFYDLTQDTIEEELDNDDGYREWSETIEQQNREQQESEATDNCSMA